MVDEKEFKDLKQTVYEIAKILQFVVYGYKYENGPQFKAASQILKVEKGVDPFQFASDKIDEIVDRFEDMEISSKQVESSESEFSEGEEVDIDDDVSDDDEFTLDLGN
ncbi:MAG: hypothetical protein IJ772_05130 [Bacilli bacterium]|nr:hypothetical protein [Bacilli bacterium]